MCRIEAGEQLDQAAHAVEMTLAVAEAQVDRLKTCKEDTWDVVTDYMETAWQDLSYAIQRLVAAFSDGTR